MRVNELTKVRPWSKVTQQRRLRVYGHIMRMPDDVLVNAAMAEYYQKRQKKSPRIGKSGVSCGIF